MSTPRLPRQADFRKLAAAGAQVSGAIALDELERIRAELVQPGGEATVALEFRVDDEGYKVIEGRVDASLALECQRCLGPMAFPVAAEVRLAMVWGEEEIAALPQRFDGVVVGEGPSDLYDLVEEELLLAIPLAPRHPEGECAVREFAADSDQASAEGSESPFAVLAKLKESSS